MDFLMAKNAVSALYLAARPRGRTLHKKLFERNYRFGVFKKLIPESIWTEAGADGRTHKIDNICTPKTSSKIQPHQPSFSCQLAASIKIRTTLRARPRTTSARPQKRANCMGFRAQLNGLCVHYLSASDRIHEKKRSPLFFIILKKTSALFKKTTWCHMHMLGDG